MSCVELGALLEIEQRRRAGKCRADKRNVEPVRGSGGEGQREEKQRTLARARTEIHPQGTKSRRNRVAKIDDVTSPDSSANGALSPSLLASAMNVSPRFGALTMSDE